MLGEQQNTNDPFWDTQKLAGDKKAERNFQPNALDCQI